MSNTTTSSEHELRGAAAEPLTIGRRLDTFLANPGRDPLIAVGVGILAGYLLARRLGR